MLCFRSSCRAVIATLWFATWGFAVSAGAGEAIDYQDFNELNLEDLLNQTVVTASKHAQKISESPVAATVITAEQIAASGATTIPELLRDVPGMDVMTPSASHFDVSARGMNELGSNGILVLLDGRSVYADFYGITPWESLPVALEEIKVIEVIKGPGSAFYGANAFACVINIITFRPEEIEDTLVRTATTSYGDGMGSVVHGGTRGDFGWRLSTSYRHTVDWVTETREGDMMHLSGYADWQPSAESRVALESGYSDGNALVVPTSESFQVDGTFTYLRGDYAWRDLQVRWYWNAWALDFIPTSDLTVLSGLNTLSADMHDIELRHVLHSGDDHYLQWGGEFRHKTVDWTQTRGRQEQNIASAFVYDEWRAGEHLLLSVGLRYDDHPLVGGHLAPRGGIVWRPNERHALRATYGVAYRDPTYLENYWYSILAGPLGLDQTFEGDQNLKSEEIRSYEVGYQGLLRDDLMARISVFRNEVRELIEIGIQETHPSPPAPLPGIPSVIGFRNNNSRNLIGGEVSCELWATRWLQARAFWAYVWAEQADSGEQVREVPCHTAMATLKLLPLRSHEFELRTRYKSRTAWEIPHFNGSVIRDEGFDRFVADVSWNVRLDGDAARVVVVLENLFDKRFRDHPLAIEQRRRLGASLTMRF